MWGSILFSDSQADLKDAIAGGFTIVALVEDQAKYQGFGFVTLGILLPPPEAISAEIDQRYDEAAAIYISYLNTPERLSVLAMLLTALYSGKKLLIYLPRDESMNFQFIQVFAQFFANYFGITIGSSAVDSNMSMEPACMANIANVMYSFDCIPFNVYCDLMPMGAPPSEMVVSKMMQQLGTNGYQFQSMEQCIAYCAQYIMDEKRQISARNQDPSQLFNPVFRVTQ